MRFAIVLIFCVVALALAGCSKPSKQTVASVDYHSLISYGAGEAKYYASDPNLPAMKHAQMMCTEAASSPAGNAWCDAVHKAMVCGSSLKRGANETGPQWAAFVEKHPSVECPPK